MQTVDLPYSNSMQTVEPKGFSFNSLTDPVSKSYCLVKHETQKKQHFLYFMVQKHTMIGFYF